MLENGKRQKKRDTPTKEKKGTSSAEARADDRASRQQGLVSATATHASYSQSMITKCRSKAKIQKEFRARNKLMENAETAKHNENCYCRYA